MGTKPEEVVHSRSSLGKSTSSHSIGVFAESLDEQPYGKHVCFLSYPWDPSSLFLLFLPDVNGHYLDYIVGVS